MAQMNAVVSSRGMTSVRYAILSETLFAPRDDRLDIEIINFTTLGLGGRALHVGVEIGVSGLDLAIEFDGPRNEFRLVGEATGREFLFNEWLKVGWNGHTHDDCTFPPGVALRDHPVSVDIRPTLVSSSTRQSLISNRCSSAAAASVR